MEATGFFNMYRIVKGLSGSHRSTVGPQRGIWKKAYGIYSNRVGTGSHRLLRRAADPRHDRGALCRGMDEAFNLQERFAWYKANNCINATYPYGSEFAYDNTGEEAPSPPSRP